MSTRLRSLLPTVLAADNFPSSPYSDPYPSSHPPTREHYVPFHLTFEDFQHGLLPMGLLRPGVVQEMRGMDEGPWNFQLSGVDVGGGHDGYQVQSEDGGDGEGSGGEEDGMEVRVECVFFKKEVVDLGFQGVGKEMERVVTSWKNEGKFEEALGGWRNELYSVYAHPSSSGLRTVQPGKPFSNAAFALERSACAVFGLATHGVHMTVYEGEGDELKIWVPRRAKTKATWPGWLDNSVAGGIPAGMSPVESMVKECDEEASLPEALVRKRLRNVGLATYFYITEGGYLQPEIEYIYDLQLPPRNSSQYARPHPHDDEVESFALLTIPQVIEALHSGDFKPNCGVILVDFLVRHGIVTPENEPNYLEIGWRSHRRLAVAVPS